MSKLDNATTSRIESERTKVDVIACIARYLAGASLPPSRRLETHLKARTPKQVRPLAKGEA
jgi:hypothetical protein